MLDFERSNVLILIGCNGNEFGSGESLSLQNVVAAWLSANLKYTVTGVLIFGRNCKKKSKLYLDNMNARFVFV